MMPGYCLLINNKIEFAGWMQDSNRIKITAVIIFLTCGTLSTVAFKLMNNQEVIEGGITRQFFHPYMQVFVMFVGESVWLLVYLLSKKDHQVPLEQGKQPHRFYIFFIPALSDACSSTLQFMGLNFISGSTFLMFKGSSIVTTAIFSKLLFDMKVELRHWIGCTCAVIGLMIVGASGYIEPSGSQQKSNTTLGYSLMLVSLIFNGFLYAYEQYLLRKYTIQPLEMIGWEGVFGMIIIGCVSLILSFVPCHISPKVCVNDSNGSPYFERVDSFFVELFSSAGIGLLMLLGFITLAIYNLNGVRITKLFDALTRSLLNISKTATVWVLGIFLTLIMSSNPTFRIESRNVWVNMVKIVGFAFIIFGTLTYNKLILKRYLASKELEMGQHATLQQEKEVQEKGVTPVPVDSD